MAEGGVSKGGTLAKAFQKRVFRTKEKVLQNLGKADKTTDVTFDDHVINFVKQQSAANRLEKELKSYLACVKAMSIASKNFYEAIKETYETDWEGQDEVVQNINYLNNIWENYQQSLIDQVQNPLQNYRQKFPEIRHKIGKRGRKLVDYDSARHNLDAQQTAKKPDDGKIAKAQEELAEAKQVYETLNNDLHEELPSLYQSRISFTTSHFYSLFSTEAKFDEEAAKLKNNLADVSLRLSKDSDNAAFKINSHRQTSHNESQDFNDKHDVQDLSTMYDHKIPNNFDDMRTSAVSNSSQHNGNASNQEMGRSSLGQEVEQAMPTEESGFGEATTPSHAPSADITNEAVKESPAPDSNAAEYSTQEDVDDIYKVPASNAPVQPTESVKDGILYQVEATHPYSGEDTDELTFESGDIINVIPYDDPEDQDEGWLYGYIEGKKEKGVFPANFTKRI